jgi:translation initiation factor 2 subunit 1
LFVACLQSAMRKAEAVSTEETEVKMKLVAPPLYVLTTQTLDKAEGMELLTKACKACQETIEACKGKLVVKAEARVVSTQDDRLLNEQLENLAKANAEVDGDADSEEEVEGMVDVDLSGPGITA